MGKAVAIVVAAGTGERLGLPTPKAFVPLGGRPITTHSPPGARHSNACWIARVSPTATKL